MYVSYSGYISSEPDVLAKDKILVIDDEKESLSERTRKTTCIK